MLLFGNDLSSIATYVLVAVFALAYHELAHALVADRLGDPTPRQLKRISANPIVHLDWFGMFMLLMVGIGWATTPVNPSLMRGTPRKAMAKVAVAGPIANLIMATAFALVLRSNLITLLLSGDAALFATRLASTGVTLNLLLMLFNLIPFPPLDGFSILLGMLPPELAYNAAKLRRFGSISLLVVIFLLPNLGFNLIQEVIWPMMNRIANFLVG